MWYDAVAHSMETAQCKRSIMMDSTGEHSDSEASCPAYNSEI